jgi:hypothetical protein
MMILSLKIAEDYSPIKENTAEIKSNPYYEVQRVEILKLMKDNLYEDKLKKMKKTFISTKKEIQSLNYYVLMTPLSSKAGSKRSKRFL